MSVIIFLFKIVSNIYVRSHKFKMAYRFCAQSVSVATLESLGIVEKVK